MSRTIKDRPYWVRLNQEATYTTHHHHRRWLGMPFDHCTEGVKLTGKRFWWDLPCTPEFSPGDSGYWGYAQDKSAEKRSYSRERYSAERRQNRDTLIREANRYNSGYEVDDWDEEDSLTGQHRHSMNWDLW